MPVIEMDYAIVRVAKANYPLFDDMVFFRIHGRERNRQEFAESKNFDAVYQTLDDKNLHIFAVLLDGEFVAWISAVYIPKVGRTNGKGHLFVDELYVSPAYRQRGLAKALLERAELLAKEIGALGLRLYVNTDYAEAIALYKKCGYSTQGEALFMNKEWND